MKDNELDAQVWLEGYVRGTVGEDGLTVFDLAELRDALTALCREYAASELRAAAGEDSYDGDAAWENGRNELRRTLRVRADELDGGK